MVEGVLMALQLSAVSLGLAAGGPGPQTATESGGKVQGAEDRMAVVVLASSRNLEEKQEPLLFMRSRKELRDAAGKLGLKVRDYADLGVVLEDGDPLGIEARASRVAILRFALDRMDRGEEWIRFESLPKELQPEMSRIVDSFIQDASWLANVADKSRMPMYFGRQSTVRLEHGGKGFDVPVRGVAEPPAPEPRDYPVAAGFDPVTGKGKPEPLPSHDTYRFHSRAVPTHIAAKLKLVRAYLLDGEERAQRFFDEWNALADRFPTPLNGAPPVKGQRYSDLDPGVRGEVDRHIERAWQSYGFESKEAAYRFLREAEVRDVLSYVQLSFRLRLPNGNTTGGSFSIWP